MRPSKRLLTLTVIWTFIALMLALSQWLPDPYNIASLQEIWFYCGIVLALLAVVDTFGKLRATTFKVRRTLPKQLPLGRWAEISLQIAHHDPKPYRIVLADNIPSSGEVLTPYHEADLKPQHTSEISYTFKPNRRGLAVFDGIWVRYPSWLKLWDFHTQLPCKSKAKVYPDYAATQRLGLLNFERQINQLGARRHIRRGQGMEFHQLREYRQGDSMRQIHWKATSKHRELIASEYQEETHQDIIFLLDCGRKMRSIDGKLTYFDHALNSLLVMSYIALKQGDGIGCLSFSGEQRWQPPLRGTARMNNLLEHIYDLETSTVTSDYMSAAQNLMVHQKRRALIVIISNVQDENSDDILPAIKLLQRKNLVMLANLEEPVMADAQHTTVTDFDESMKFLGAYNHLKERHRLMENLRKKGIIGFNCLPSKLAPELVNHYLLVKSQGRL